MAVVAHPEAARRVRAARAYAGYSKPEDLSDAIDERGLGRTTLYAIERERRPLRRQEAWAIAEACGLPLAFFEADFSRLSELVDEVSPSGLAPDQEAAADEMVQLLEQAAEEHSTPRGARAPGAPSRAREGRGH